MQLTNFNKNQLSLSEYIQNKETVLSQLEAIKVIAEKLGQAATVEELTKTQINFKEDTFFSPTCG